MNPNDFLEDYWQPVELRGALGKFEAGTKGLMRVSHDRLLFAPSRLNPFPHFTVYEDRNKVLECVSKLTKDLPEVHGRYVHYYEMSDYAEGNPCARFLWQGYEVASYQFKELRYTYELSIQLDHELDPITISMSRNLHEVVQYRFWAYQDATALMHHAFDMMQRSIMGLLHEGMLRDNLYNLHLFEVMNSAWQTEGHHMNTYKPMLEKLEGDLAAELLECEIELEKPITDDWEDEYLSKKRDALKRYKVSNGDK